MEKRRKALIYLDSQNLIPVMKEKNPFEKTTFQPLNFCEKPVPQM